MLRPGRIELREIVLAMAVLVAHTALFLHWDLLVDDAFISFRYAQSLLGQGELSYNPGERVEGCSNLLWTLMLALFASLGVGMESAARVLGYLSSLGCLGLVFQAARRVLRLGPLEAFSVALLCVSSKSFSFWAASGLETPLFAALLVGVYLLLAGPERETRGVRLALLATLTALTRPEGLLVAAALPGLLLLGGSRQLARRLALVLALTLGGLELWRACYFGSWLPNAVQAKTGCSLPALARGGRYLWKYLVEERALFLLPLWLIGLTSGWCGRALGVLLGGYAALMVVAGGDGLYRYRLPAQMVPLLALGIGAGIKRLGASRRGLGPLLGLASLAVWAEPLCENSFFAGASLREVRAWEARWAQVGRALGRVAPRSALLATNVAGRVPYYSRLRTLDLLGLTDPVLARAPVSDFGRGYAGHERAWPEYVLWRQPELVYFSVLDRVPRAILTDPRGPGLVLRAGSLYRYAPLVEAEVWRRAYRPALLVLGDGSTAALFVRRHSPTELRAGRSLELLEWSGSTGAERGG